MPDFWQLPGPSRFLMSVTEDLRRGSSVVVLFPELPPPDWMPALRQTAHQSNLGLALESFKVPSEGSPIRALAEFFSPEHATSVRTAMDLVRQPQLQGRGVVLQLHLPSHWPIWHNFLLEFADVVRRSELRPCDRPVFLVPLFGELDGSVPQSEVAFRVHRWSNVVNRLDMQLWATTMLAGSPEPFWQRQLRVAIAVELALWDTELCTQACALDLGQLIQPTTWLAAFACSCGWDLEVAGATSLVGRTDQQREYEGRPRNHSAWLALQGRVDVIERRVWQAQLTVLFPLLENHRQELLSGNKSGWCVPWKTNYGFVERLEDLELNHLADQLRSQRFIGNGQRDLFDFVCWLRDIRNDLAHLVPVSSTRLLNDRFEPRFSRYLVGDD